MADEKHQNPLSLLLFAICASSFNASQKLTKAYVFMHAEKAQGMAGRKRGVGGKTDVHEGNEGIDALPLDGVLHWHHSCLCTGLMVDQGGLHLCRAYPVPTHIDHIIHTACIILLTMCDWDMAWSQPICH